MSLQEISNTVVSLPIASIGCTAAGLYIGRKWCAAGIYKVLSIVANIIASKKAHEWNQTSHEYWTGAKKLAVRDLTAATGLLMLGLASGFAKEKVVPKEEPELFHTLGNYGWTLGKILSVACFAPAALWCVAMLDSLHKK